MPGTEAGIEYLLTPVDLVAGVWTPTTLEITLPGAGTYVLDADVRGLITGIPSFDSWITARLFDVTADLPVLNSERLVLQVADQNPGDVGTGSNATASISALLTVSRQTVIQVQGLRVDGNNGATVSQICSDANGRTSLRFLTTR